MKQEGLRQRVAFGRDLLRLRWVFGARGMVENLTKNGFAILRFNAWFAALAVCGVLLVNVGRFVGVGLASGWARVGFLIALLAVVMVYLGMSWHSDISPLYAVLHPVGAIVFCYALVRSAVLTLALGEWSGAARCIRSRNCESLAARSRSGRGCRLCVTWSAPCARHR